MIQRRCLASVCHGIVIIASLLRRYFFGDDIIIKGDNPELRIYMNQSAYTARLRQKTKLPSLPAVPEE
jgi:hypothetical protein